LCRDLDYLNLNIRFAASIAKNADIINLFPAFLKPVAARIFTDGNASIRHGMKHIGPIVQERLKMEKEYGRDWPGKPNDLITWLLEEGKGDERSPRAITESVLAVNFGAIHTTSISFIHALYYLIRYPEYVRPLREEVESVVKEEGWTKEAMNKMIKLDSFLKESQRLKGLRVYALSRKVLKDFTFSDGTVLPAGTELAAARGPIHMNAAIYPNPDEFDGFRFANLMDGDHKGTKSQMVTTNVDYLSFGHGKLACPGRFMAVNTLKTMMSYILIKYDVKFEDEGVQPQTQWFGSLSGPNRKSRVIFRERWDTLSGREVT